MENKRTPENEPAPELMPIKDLMQWFNQQDFAPDAEIGKVHYAYADPIADAHNWRDQEKKLHWVFTNIKADVWDEISNTSVEIDLDEPYQMLYDVLGSTAPHPEDFSIPLRASVFKDALVQVNDYYADKEETN